MVASAIALTSSREVLNIKLTDPPLANQNPNYLTVLVSPSFPDGIEYRDIEGEQRILGYTKIADFGTNTVRNATPAEISTFEPAYVVFEAAMAADAAIELAEVSPHFRRVFKALLKVLVTNFNATNGRVNALSTRLEAMRDNLNASTTYGGFRTPTIALPEIPANLTDTFTLAQAAQFLRNQISVDD